MMRVAGADGCRAGWVVYCEGVWTVVPDFLTLWTTCKPDLLAVDIPIGLGPQRACDRLCRQALGPRRSSLFPAPNRRLLACTTYAEANALSRSLFGRGLSVQAFNIFPKIAEVDAALAQHPELRAKTFECHPELSFARLHGEPMPFSKKSADGAAMRANLLGIDLPEMPRFKTSVALIDDQLDAAVAEWTARRISQGTASSFPPEPDLDAVGLDQRIWA